MRQNIRLRGVFAFGFDDDQNRAFIPFLVPCGDSGGIGDRRMRDGDIFKFNRRNPFATGFDDVLGAVADDHIAIRINRRHITAIKPAVVSQGGLINAEIGFNDPVTANLQIALGFTIFRQQRAVLIDQTQLYP